MMVKLGMVDPIALLMGGTAMEGQSGTQPCGNLLSSS